MKKYRVKTIWLFIIIMLLIFASFIVNDLKINKYIINLIITILYSIILLIIIKLNKRI